MDITAFGSCRLRFAKHNQLNLKTSMTYSTKDAIQLINFLNGKLKIPAPYGKLCFREGYRKNKELVLDNELKNSYKNSKLFLIEICSRKKYVHNGFYLFEQSVDKDNIAKKKNKECDDICNNYKLEIQSDKEILKDILYIRDLLSPKPIIIVSHYNFMINDNKRIEARYGLIKLLNKICKKNNIPFINPAEVLKDYKQEEILKDQNHYSGYGIQILRKYFNEYVKNFI